MTAEITLVLGGARSGKSEVAERLGVALATPVAYMATGPSSEDDAEWARRVSQHRARRPPNWTTIELGPGGDLAAALRDAAGAVLVDSLGTWILGLPAFGVEGTETASLCDRLVERRADGRPTVLVSEEVGLGVHPFSEAGREFRDALGVLNRDVARVADAVHLVVAGRVLTLGRDGP